MYCPDCGSENPEQRRFCRSCGLTLQTTPQGLANEISATKVDTSPIEIISRQQKGWQNPIIYAFLTILLGLITRFLGKRVFFDETTADIGAVLALVGVFLVFLRGVLEVTAPFSNQPRAKPQGKPVATVPPTLLSAEPASVTEHTTRQLDTSLENSKERPRNTRPTL